MTVRSSRLAAVLAVAAAMLLSGAPAQAAPPVKPGPVTNLAATAAKPAGYQVDATWDAATDTTIYEVSLSLGGVVVSKNATTGTTWSASTTAGAGQTVVVTVTPYNGKRKGTATSVSLPLPDLTAPTGAFSVSAADSTGTITQLELSDDATATNEIQREVDWGDGSGWQVWSLGDTTDHVYAGLGRYVPQVRLTDVSGNSVVLTLTAIVVGDVTAPTGTFTAGPGTAWATLTEVTLTQVSLADDSSATEALTLSADWGDGTVEPFVGPAMTHVYATAGSFTPTVYATDEAGNVATLAAQDVVVSEDTIGPALTITKPRNASSLRSWRYVKGKAHDAETGVSWVKIRLVEKRGSRWYAYLPARGVWVKAGVTPSSAWKKAKDAKRVPGSTGAWRLRVKKLTKGQLRVRVTGVDLVGNAAARAARGQKLTRR